MCLNQNKRKIDMSLLTDEEIEAIWCNSNPSYFEAQSFARALEAAILAKLASAELPQPYEMTGAHGYEYVFDEDDLRQAFAQGAASQLAQEPSAYLWAPRKKPELAKLAFQPEPSIQLKALGYLSQPLFTRKEPK
jgi:hypothetical protein